MIIKDKISLSDLQKMQGEFFNNMVKGVVDIGQGLLAVNAEMHADLERELLQQGSNQEDLWGINLYPSETGENFLEFDSMINIRPRQNNRTRGVDDPAIREKIAALVKERVGQ